MMPSLMALLYLLPPAMIVTLGKAHLVVQEGTRLKRYPYVRVHWARIAPSRRVPYLWGLTFGGTVNGSAWSRQIEMAVELPAEAVRSFLCARGLPVQIQEKAFVAGQPRDGCGLDTILRWR